MELLSLLLLLTSAGATQLMVELSAPWHSSRTMETASFLFARASSREDFLNFILDPQTRQHERGDTYLDLALRSGEFVPFVETHFQLTSKLRHELDIQAQQFMVYDSSDSVRVFTVGDLPGSEGECANSITKLQGFDQLDFAINLQTVSQLLCVVHGDLDSKEFFQLVDEAKRRFWHTHRIVVRMTSSSNPESRLGGFSVSLDIKNTEYVQTSEGNGGDGSGWESGLDFAKLKQRFPNHMDSLNHLQGSLKSKRERLNPWEIADLSIQLALYVLEKQPTNASAALFELKQVVENLPSFVRVLAKIPVSDLVQQQVQTNNARVMGGSRSALFYNHRNIDAKTPLHDLVQVLRLEDEFVALASQVANSPNEFNSYLITEKGRGSWGQGRVDVKRYAKGAVAFWNDLEKDAMYRSLPQSFSQQFSRPDPYQQLIQVRRNLYTAILVIDPTSNSQVEWLSVIQHFVKMGAPIRFGLVLASDSVVGQCAVKLFSSARKEYGMDAALDFIKASAGLGSCEELTEPFGLALSKATGSWSASKFTSLASSVIEGKHDESEQALEKSLRYVRELGLPVPSLLFNGQLVDGMTSPQFRLDRALQTVLFAEQDLFQANVGKFDDSQDILTQVLLFSNAKPALSKFRQQQQYLTKLPQQLVWSYYPSSTATTARVTVWLSPKQTVSILDADVRIAAWEAGAFPDSYLAIVNGRIISSSTNPSDQVLTEQDLHELVEVERQRLSRVPQTKSAQELLLCSLALAHRLDVTGKAPSVSVEDDGGFAVVDPASDASWRVLTLVVNPLDANTPKLAAMAHWINQEFQVPVKLLFTPEMDVAQLPPSSFHRWSGPNPTVVFDTLLVPVNQVLTLKMQANANWVVFPNLELERDPDNLLLQHGEADYTARYQVAHVLVDGHCHVQQTGEPAAGLQLELVATTGLLEPSSSSVVVSDSIVMHNLGYWQVKAAFPGVYLVRPKPQSRDSDRFPPTQVSLHLFSGSNPVELQVKPLTNSLETTHNEDDTMHVFSLASGALYERFLRIMMLSVRKRSTGKIKFWLLENYMSREMKEFLPGFAIRNDFEYELVTFKWPEWLRGQSERQRQIWGMKILFLDVLFPLHLKRIIYVDADQVLRADLRELWALDLKGAPYAMTPFCDSRKETLGFQFWRQGFWAQHLRGKSYHISALFVVDLQVFRRNSVGDRLRAIYQQLSADPGSLSNLDQDLPNFAQQHDIAIYSLPQEWLWCESWCSDASLAGAKTIDLCNNPLRKEPKLDMAKRVIKGHLFAESWEQLDEQVGWTPVVSTQS
ncbi:hypothetical protein BASA81_006346 [Batrachochytrium salamandrivorans]|nr:hypothetical protein BASA81_006346 [Batrachochytrium salamandrivorans]